MNITIDTAPARSIRKKPFRVEYPALGYATAIMVARFRTHFEISVELPRRRDSSNLSEYNFEGFAHAPT